MWRTPLRINGFLELYIVVYIVENIKFYEYFEYLYIIHDDEYIYVYIMKTWWYGLKGKKKGSFV